MGAKALFDLRMLVVYAGASVLLSGIQYAWVYWAQDYVPVPSVACTLEPGAEGLMVTVCGDAREYASSALVAHVLEHGEAALSCQVSRGTYTGTASIACEIPKATDTAE